MYIDVRDLGELHSLALTTEGAGNERYIVDAGNVEWQQFRMSPFFSTVRYSSHECSLRLPYIVDAADGRPLSTAIFQPLNITDKSKSQRVFNFKYRTIEETTKDTIDEYKRRGWISS
jgi:nucleoside-diphosphate-sugar epimerase